MPAHQGSTDPGGAPPGGEKIKLVTIHGTGAGDTTTTGDRWWQHGSGFLTELGRRLDLDPARVEVVPFRWEEGPNSETRRREAGASLLACLRGYEEAGADYHLIGHSHGGSVAYSALLQSVAEGAPLERLRSWCTVGTPFLDYRPNPFLFQRLRSFGLALYTTGITSLFVGPIVLLSVRTRPQVFEDGQLLSAMGAALILYGVLCVFTLFVRERRQKAWRTEAQKSKTADRYQDQWLGLWHPEDEAVSALANVKHASGSIIPPTFLKPVVSSVWMLTIVTAGAILAFDTFARDGSMLSWVAQSLSEDLWEEGASLVEQVLSLAWMIAWMLVVFLLPVAWIGTLLLGLVARVLGGPLSTVLNRLVWTSVRQRAWGDDVLKEDVQTIHAHPPNFARRFKALPESVADPLREYSEKHAILTLHKVRELLGMTRDSRPSQALRSELSENLQWKELIHTAYFDVPQLVDLLAVGLHRAGLADLEEGFARSSERDRLEAWWSTATESV